MIQMISGIFLLSFSSLAVASDPCSEQSQLVDEKELAQCRSEGICSRAQRVQLACHMRDAIVAQYAGLHLQVKKDRLGKTSLEHLNGCVRTEVDTHDNNDLKFFDRMRACIAAFKDSHFRLKAQARMPWVISGIEVKEAKGKFYISKRYRKVLTVDLSSDAASARLGDLSIGREVISVDGKPIQEWVNEYSKYVSGSSPQSVREDATSHVFTRNYRFPTKRTLKVVLGPKGNSEGSKNERTEMILKWWIADSGGKNSTAVKYLLHTVGIPDGRVLRRDYEEKEGSWKISEKNPLDSDGYDPSTPIAKNKGNLNSYEDQHGDVTLREGRLVPGRTKPSVCYLQILSFDHELEGKVKRVSDGKEVSFFNTVRDFVTRCSYDHFPMVIDIRNNPGGNGKFPNQFLSLFMRSKTEFPGAVKGLRYSVPIFRYLENAVDYGSNEVKNRSQFTRFQLESLFENYKNHSEKDGPHLPMVVTGRIKPHGVVGGYDHAPVVALITPNCVSACDMFASLLKKSGTATLIGTQTNGTGLGYSSTSSHHTSWRDIAHGLFKINIPNLLFGTIDQFPADGSMTHSIKNDENAVLENHPTVADVMYWTTRTEIMSPTSPDGWLGITIKTIQKIQSQREEQKRKSEESSSPKPTPKKTG